MRVRKSFISLIALILQVPMSLRLITRPSGGRSREETRFELAN